MREFHIGKNDENQRLDRFLGKAVPLLPASLAQKYIRLKRIKVNGARAQRDQKLVAGDILQCYINDEFFESPSEENVYLTITTPRLKIVYEDENIMLLDKPAGQVVHADEHEKVNTLVNHMLAYLGSAYGIAHCNQHLPVRLRNIAIPNFLQINCKKWIRLGLLYPILFVHRFICFFILKRGMLPFFFINDFSLDDANIWHLWMLGHPGIQFQTRRPQPRCQNRP